MTGTQALIDRPAGPWLDRADPLTALLWRQSGILSRRQALRHLRPAAIRHRLATGRWRRAHHGVYVAHDGPVTRPQVRWIAYLGCGPGACLAGRSAAERCGLRGYATDTVHILLPARRQDSTPPAGVAVHRTACLARTDVNPAGAPPHTTAARSLVDSAQWAYHDEDAYALIAAGFQQRLVSGYEIREVLDRLPRVRRRALIVQAAADALGGAHSLPETEFVRHLRRAGLPLPRLQIRRRDASGRSRYLDGYYERWGVHIEIDGGQHLEVRAYWRDMRRQNELWIVGDRVLRFPSWAVRYRPDEVIAQVRAALLAAGWQPPR